VPWSAIWRLRDPPFEAAAALPVPALTADQGHGPGPCRSDRASGAGGYTVIAAANPLRGLAAGADVIRSEAQRAGADITEVEGSHVIMISQPQAVTDVIVTAAKAVAGSHR